MNHSIDKKNNDKTATDNQWAKSDSGCGCGCGLNEKTARNNQWISTNKIVIGDQE